MEGEHKKAEIPSGSQNGIPVMPGAVFHIRSQRECPALSGGMDRLKIDYCMEGHAAWTSPQGVEERLCRGGFGVNLPVGPDWSGLCRPFHSYAALTRAVRD